MTLFLRLLFAFAFVALLVCSLTQARYNKKLKIGDAAPTWEKLEAHRRQEILPHRLER